MAEPMDKNIWDLLARWISNPYGAAAIMGNLFAESSMNPLCMTGKNKKNYTSARQYADMVNSGTLSKNSFIHDGIAFGLVQWCFYTRKAGFYDYAKAKNLDIGDYRTQMAYLVEEMSTKYKTAWNAVIYATSIDEASDIVMLKYENPATKTEAAKAKRRKAAHGYFDKYFVNDGKQPEEATKKTKKVVTTAPKVYVRHGNGKNFKEAGQIMIQGKAYPWIATAENGWHAVLFREEVCWISGEFSKVEEVAE